MNNIGHCPGLTASVTKTDKCTKTKKKWLYTIQQIIDRYKLIKKLHFFIGSNTCLWVGNLEIKLLAIFSPLFTTSYCQKGKRYKINYLKTCQEIT